jgi:hypothetical protein
MFDPTTQKVTLSEKHDFDFYNVFEVQDEIGRRVAESLHSRFRSAVPKWSLWSPAKNFQHAEAIAALELCWPHDRISSGLITAWPRFASTSDDLRKRESHTNSRCGLEQTYTALKIQRL